MNIVKITKLMILLALVGHCFSAPKRFDFICNEAQVEKKF